MNKTLLATAVAAATTAAMAPGLATADVKIFGTIQAEYGNIDVNRRVTDVDTNSNGGSTGAINGGGSNQFGVKGSEKLGNGLSVYFKLNHQFETFNATAAGNDLAARDRFVGIKGDGWHVQTGMMNLAYKETTIGYDPFVATGLQARAIGGVSGMQNGYARDVIEVGFKSGAINGSIQMKHEDPTGNNNGIQGGGARTQVEAGSWSGKLVYKGSNWEVNLAHADIGFDATPGAGSDGDMSATKFGAKWSGNGFTIMGQYETVNCSNSSVTGGNTCTTMDGATAAQGTNMVANAAGTANAGGQAEDVDNLMIAMKYKMTDSTSLIARYHDTDFENIAGVAANDTDADGWAIGVVHSLSKRTHVYGGYMSNDFDGKGTLTDVDVDAWGIGMRHNF